MQPGAVLPPDRGSLSVGCHLWGLKVSPHSRSVDLAAAEIREIIESTTIASEWAACTDAETNRTQSSGINAMLLTGSR